MEQNVKIVEDKIFMLIEMLDSMKSSVENLTNVIKQQEDLINLISENDKSNNFEEFLTEMKEQNFNLREQQTKLQSKIESLEMVIDYTEDNELVKTSVNYLLDALGVFNR